MKQNILIISTLCFLSLLNVSAETITHDGLRITVTIQESEFGDILEFVVEAKNTTALDKTLLGTIYLDPEKYQDMKEEERTTPVYLELPPNKSAKDVFYLIAAYEITSPKWFFEVDEVYNFIIDEDLNYDDIPEIKDEIDKEMEEDMENNEFSITGYWKMEKSEESKIYGDWSWHFKEDNTVKIGEILTVEARLPMEHEGSYEIKGNKVYISLFSGSPFPESFTIQGGQLVAEGVVLIKTDFQM